MSREERAERYFLRGMDLTARGQTSAAETYFERAEKLGMDMRARFEEAVKKDLDSFRTRVKASQIRPDVERDRVFGKKTSTERSEDSGTAVGTSSSEPSDFPPEEENPNSPPDGGPSGGYWKSVTDCDDNTFSVWAKD